MVQRHWAGIQQVHIRVTLFYFPLKWGKIYCHFSHVADCLLVWFASHDKGDFAPQGCLQGRAGYVLPQHKQPQLCGSNNLPKTSTVNSENSIEVPLMKLWGTKQRE